MRAVCAESIKNVFNRYIYLYFAPEHAVSTPLSGTKNFPRPDNPEGDPFKLHESNEFAVR